jgi:hypothetical protein
MTHLETLENLVQRSRRGDRIAAAMLQQQLAGAVQMLKARETRLERERQRRVLESYRQGRSWADAQAAAHFDESEWLIENIADDLCSPTPSARASRDFDPQADTWRG